MALTDPVSKEMPMRAARLSLSSTPFHSALEQTLFPFLFPFSLSTCCLASAFLVNSSVLKACSQTSDSGVRARTEESEVREREILSRLYLHAALLANWPVMSWGGTVSRVPLARSAKQGTQGASGNSLTLVRGFPDSRQGIPRHARQGIT